MNDTTKSRTESTMPNLSDEVFSNTLRAMQITSSLLLNDDYSAPWAVSIPENIELVESMGLNKRTHTAAFHLVKRGYVEIELEGGHREIFREGEMAICFSGKAHILSQGNGNRVNAFTDIIRGAPNSFKPSADKQAESTSLICGVFMLADTRLNPLFESLPALMKITTRSNQGYSAATTADIVKLLLAEIDQPTFAHSYLIERYLELLCAKSIQLYIDHEPKKESSWLKAIKDPAMVKVVSAIHTHPAFDWSVKNLAKLVSLSPSRFAAKFTDVIGTTPIAYVAQWRMYVASKHLSETKLSVEEISTRVGYENVAAFSRSFKRILGSSPGAWRKLADKTMQE